MSGEEDEFFYCNYNGKTTSVNIYKSFEKFKLEYIEKNLIDIEFYVLINNSLEIEIKDQQSYKDYIIDYPEIKEVFCKNLIIKDSSIYENIKEKYKKDKENILNHFKKKTVEFQNQKKEIIEENEKLKEEIEIIKKNIDEYKKKTAYKFLQIDKKLKQLSLNCTPTINNKIKNNNIISQKNQNEIKFKIETIHSSLTRKSSNNNSNNNYSYDYNYNSKYSLKFNENNKYITILLKIKNNGIMDFPKKCFLIDSPNKSEFYIKETLINNGEVLKVNQTCEVFLNLYFKRKHLKEGKYSFKFLLYNKEIKEIGNEGTIQIPYFEEKKNIVLSQNEYQNKSNSLNEK